MILVHTHIEIDVDGKIVRSTGDTIRCESREKAEALLRRMQEALDEAKNEERG